MYIRFAVSEIHQTRELLGHVSKKKSLSIHYVDSSQNDSTLVKGEIDT